MTLFDTGFLPALKKCSASERAAVRETIGQIERGEISGELSRASNAPPGSFRLRVHGRPLHVFYRFDDTGLVILALVRLVQF